MGGTVLLLQPLRTPAASSRPGTTVPPHDCLSYLPPTGCRGFRRPKPGCRSFQRVKRTPNSPSELPGADGVLGQAPARGPAYEAARRVKPRAKLLDQSEFSKGHQTVVGQCGSYLIDAACLGTPTGAPYSCCDRCGHQQARCRRPRLLGSRTCSRHKL